jgi:hypothetical protein
MGGFSLPFQGSTAALNSDSTTFEVVSEEPKPKPKNYTPGTAISGKSAGTGVYGASSGFDAVVGESSSTYHAGVTGRNLTNGADGGVGIYGVGGLYAGKFDGPLQVNGNATVTGGLTAGSVSATNPNGWAVVGVSTSQDAINATSSAPAHAGVSANNNGGGFGLWASSPGQGGVGVYGKGEKYAGQFDGVLQVNGQVYVTGTLSASDVWLPAADCAEEFDIETGCETEPGTVMVLTGSGRLRPSEQSYDKRVAGVISGAGEYSPAIVLDRHDSPSTRMPIALVGKVYCKVDAQYGEIQVGDLLTTSPTAGHAMKASEPLLAFGAVIGKALRALGTGQALIPVLIALQ